MMMAAYIGAPVAQMSSCAHHHSCVAVLSNSSSSLHSRSSSSSPSVSYLGNLNEQHSPLLSSSKLCAFTPFSSPFPSLLACCSVSMNPAAAGKMSSIRSPPRYAGNFSYITPGTPTNPVTDFLASDVRSRASVVACSSNSAHHHTGSVNPMSEAEKEGWEKRQSEAATAAAEEKNDPGPFTWEWTLNWDAITDKILVGSCPRSPDDINRMVDETGIHAVLNLQSDLCFEALKIPFLSIRNRAVFLSCSSCSPFFSFLLLPFSFTSPSIWKLGSMKIYSVFHKTHHLCHELPNSFPLAISVCSRTVTLAFSFPSLLLFNNALIGSEI